MGLSLYDSSIGLGLPNLVYLPVALFSPGASDITRSFRPFKRSNFRKCRAFSLTVFVLSLVPRLTCKKRRERARDESSCVVLSRAQTLLQSGNRPERNGLGTMQIMIWSPTCLQLPPPVLARYALYCPFLCAFQSVYVHETRCPKVHELLGLSHEY